MMPANLTASPTEKPKVTASGCAGCLMIAISLPFLLFAFSFGRKALSLDSQGKTSQATPLAMMAVVMGLSVVFFIFVPMLRARRALTDLDARKAAAPGQPWLWRADWASRRIVGSYSRKLAARWMLALVWNAIVLPGSYSIVTRARASGDHTQLLVLAFPAFGVWLLGTAIHATLRSTRYGRTVLELSTLPGAIGGKLEGRILVGRVLEPPNSVRVELACVRRLTSLAGKSQSIRESTLWQDGQLVPAVRGELEGSAIPFAFSIPEDAAPSGDQNGSGTVYWRVRAGAETPGVDYAATFEVPVFRAAEGGQAQPGS